MEEKQFQKLTENFICEHCGAEVIGDGYTNHCPKCLWGKHVDVNPGDRAEDCQGRMKPIYIEKKGDEYILTHRCEKCEFERKNKASPSDDFDEVIKISQVK